MKRHSDFLSQHQHPFSAMYTEMEKSGAPKKKGLSTVVELYVQLLENSPYNLLYSYMSKRSQWAFGVRKVLAPISFKIVFDECECLL